MVLDQAPLFPLLILLPSFFLLHKEVKSPLLAAEGQTLVQNNPRFEIHSRHIFSQFG